MRARSNERRRRPSSPTAGTTRTEWWWPPSPTIFRTIPAGYSSFEHLVLPEVDPSPAAYVWGHQFAFVGGLSGWLGLESGRSGGGDGGKAAVFEVQGAVDATGPGAGGGTGPDAAWSCWLPWPWAVGGTYRMRIWTEVEGWWSAAVGEEGRDPVIIGHVQVPVDWRRLASQSIAFSEYRGPALARCADLAASCVTFSVPTADEGTLPVRRENVIDPGTCGGSQIDDLGGGVRHRMGGA